MIKRLVHFVFDHPLLKVASLIIAVLMWYGVSHDPVAEISVRIPVEFSNPPKELEYNSDVLPQAQIRLRGPARELRDLHLEGVRALIDLQGAAPGERTYDLTANEVQVPHDLEVMQVTPGRLHLMFDTRSSRAIAVRPRVVGAPPPGYRIVSVVADPAEVAITGPTRHVRAAESAVTDPVDVTAVEGRMSFESTPYVADPTVHVVSPGPVRVVVTTERTSSKTGTP
jgi:YbbR domain-containing protein